MPQELAVLYVTAASIGFLHTLLGPDHYLPFIVMARARRWSLTKTAWITLACGVGHVGSSVLLGAIGIALGIGVSRLEGLESFRGNIAAWLLIGFGLVYSIWGLRRAIKSKPHAHLHVHMDGTAHTHGHRHHEDHAHVHEESAKSITPWVLFTVFVLGPCEPLIPILMYPAARSSVMGVVTVAAIFGAVTVATMMGIVMIAIMGIDLVPMKRLEPYAHALAGGMICLSGVAIQFLGL